MSLAPISQNETFMEEWRGTLDNEEVIKSPCVLVNVPEETVIDRVLRSLKTHSSIHPEKAAVMEASNQDRWLSHQQIHDRALSFAAFLVSRGFEIGDRVTLALPNSIEWPVLHLGAWAAGGTVVGSSVAFKLYETVYQLRDSASSVVVTSEQMLDLMVEAAKECPSVKMMICVRSSGKDLSEGVIDFEETINHEPFKKIAPVTLDTECLIYYSSGTTGQPKGVIHTHRTFHCAIEMLRSHWVHEVYPVLGVKEVDWYQEWQIITSSCYHLLGFLMLNWFLITGSPMVLMRAFDGDLYQEVIEAFEPRFLVLAPPVFSYLTKDEKGKKASLSSVQMILSSTAPISKEMGSAFLVHHPNVKYIVQAYGATEIFFSHLPHLVEEGFHESGGILASFYEQKIVDPDTLQSYKKGQRGEVWVRGSPQTIGYLNKPKATKALIDEEGWIHTGDIGYLDGRGLLHIVDRMKDLIKVNYMNQTLQVPPAELEGILHSHHKVREAAIVGVPDDSRGELVRAYVVKDEEMLTEKEVEDYIADKLAVFKRITGGVIFVDAIPKSPAGKILRRVLRETAR